MDVRNFSILFWPEQKYLNYELQQGELYDLPFYTTEIFLLLFLCWFLIFVPHYNSMLCSVWLKTLLQCTSENEINNCAGFLKSHVFKRQKIILQKSDKIKDINHSSTQHLIHAKSVKISLEINLLLIKFFSICQSMVCLLFLQFQLLKYEKYVSLASFNCSHNWLISWILESFVLQ